MEIISNIKQRNEEARLAEISNLQSKISSLSAEKKELTEKIELYDIFKKNLVTLSSDLLDSSTKIEEAYQVVIKAVAEAQITSELEKIKLWANDIKNEKTSVEAIISNVNAKINKFNDSITNIKSQISKIQARITNLGG